MAKLKIINIDSSLDNADWIKRGKPDIQNTTSASSVLKFLGINKPLEELNENEIEEIMDYPWFAQLPRYVRLSFSQRIFEINEKTKKEKIEKDKNAPF
jgi:hypothetical protein